MCVRHLTQFPFPLLLPFSPKRCSCLIITMFTQKHTSGHVHTHVHTRHTLTVTHAYGRMHSGICVHMYTEPYTRAHRHALTHTLTCTHMCTHTHARAHAHTHTHTHTCTHTCTNTRTHMHSLTHSHTHALTRAHSHTRTHMRTHTHTHTHALTLTPFPSPAFTLRAKHCKVSGWTKSATLFERLLHATAPLNHSHSHTPHNPQPHRSVPHPHSSPCHHPSSLLHTLKHSCVHRSQAPG